MARNEKGLVHFLPLLIVAALLIWAVGYISITRLKQKGLFMAVLGETVEVNENDLKNEESALNAIGDLNTDDLEKESSVPAETVQVEKTPAPVEKANLSLSGFISYLIEKLSSLLF